MTHVTAGFRFLLFAPLLAAAPASATAPAATCGPAALADGSVVRWEPASGVVADFDMDGEPDVAYLGRDAERTLVMIAACRGDDVRRRWLFAVPPEAMASGAPRLEPVSLLLDPEAVARACASSTSASECEHLRRTNRERQAWMDAGARGLRVGSPGSAGVVFRWMPDLGGFVQARG